MGSVEIRPIAISSQCDEITSFVGKGHLVAFRPKVVDDCCVEFKQLYMYALKENPALGAAIRWSIYAKGKTSLSLVLQSLRLARNPT
jgi:hypothetical protein